MPVDGLRFACGWLQVFLEFCVGVASGLGYAWNLLAGSTSGVLRVGLGVAKGLTVCLGFACRVLGDCLGSA